MNTRRATRKVLPSLLLSGLLLGSAPGWATASAHGRDETVPGTSDSATPTIAQLVGQKLVVAMSGTTPDADLLGRIERGEVGGVILFGSNITTAAALRALTHQLRQAAVAGGQPALLIATDQEGGSVKRLSWAPPTLSPPEMGELASASTAEEQGQATAHVLRCAGINNDLAPVADVPSSTSSFMYQDGRTWSFDASLTASMSGAFATGLETKGVVPAMKHFPGIGLVATNTDSSVVTITASKPTLAPGLLPYQEAIGNGLPLIMLSNATYTAYDPINAAGWSHAISVDLLRTTLGFSGVTMTDSLNGTAAARGVSATSLARSAAQAGTDMILLTGSETASAATYDKLIQDAEAGTIPLATLEASYARILTLKAQLKGPVADTAAPTLGAPRSRLFAPSTLGSTTAPVATTWSASDPCAISRFKLERQVNGGSLTVQTLSPATATSIAQRLTIGSIYGYAVKATDGAGNSTAWTDGVSFEPFVRQSTTGYVTYSTGWSTVDASGFSGGSTRYATAAGAWASYSFTGASIGWVAAVGPGRGSARVYIDGVYQATVSLYAANAARRRIAYTANWRTQGAHTIKIVVVGTAGHPRVDVDAFVRLYRPQ